mgnify:CR=1 FL=1
MYKRQQQDIAILEPGVGETPLWPEVRVSALFDPDADRARILETLGRALGSVPETPLWEHLEARAWEREWLQHFAPVRFGARLWVCPSGATVEQADAVVMHLDPGLAFGTGTHPTTALCLEWLAGHPCDGRQVIDYGSGSGILGVAALLLGATRVRAVDSDPQALLASRDNATRNGIDAARLETCAPQALDETGPADVLLANILAGPLVELAPPAQVDPADRVVGLPRAAADQRLRHPVPDDRGDHAALPDGRPAAADGAGAAAARAGPPGGDRRRGGRAMSPTGVIEGGWEFVVAAYDNGVDIASYYESDVNQLLGCPALLFTPCLAAVFGVQNSTAGADNPTLLFIRKDDAVESVVAFGGRHRQLEDEHPALSAVFCMKHMAAAGDQPNFHTNGGHTGRFSEHTYTQSY